MGIATITPLRRTTMHLNFSTVASYRFTNHVVVLSVPSLHNGASHHCPVEQFTFNTAVSDYSGVGCTPLGNRALDNVFIHFVSPLNQFIIQIEVSSTCIVE